MTASFPLHKGGPMLVEIPALNKGTVFTEAERVAAVVFERNLARINPPPNGDINNWLQTMLFKPEYTTLRPID